jgi:hypothetical protein
MADHVGINTFRTYLMQGTGTGTLTWAKLVDIKDFSDLGAAPEPIETTTLSDPARTYIPGIENTEQKTFTCNFNNADYATLAALKGQEINVGVWFGASYDDSTGTYTPDGNIAKFTGKGYIDVFVNGGGVNEVVNMTVTLTMTQNFIKQAA